MKRKALAIVICLAMIMISAVGCGSGKLAEDFDKDEVVAEAKAIIEHVNAGDLDTVYEEKFSAKMKLAMTAEKWNETIAPIVEEMGEFEEFEKEAVTGTKDKDTEEEFATVVLVAKYKNGKSQYTVSLNKSMKVVGFFIK